MFKTLSITSRMESKQSSCDKPKECATKRSVNPVRLTNHIIVLNSRNTIDVSCQFPRCLRKTSLRACREDEDHWATMNLHGGKKTRIQTKVFTVVRYLPYS